MRRSKKLYVIVIVLIAAAAAAICARFAFYQSHNYYEGSIGTGGMVILNKTRTYENGEQIILLTVSQRMYDKEYVFHAGIFGDRERQNLLYDALFTGVAYNDVIYSYNIPRKIAEQNEVAVNGVVDILELLNNPEMTEKYLKVAFVGAEEE